MALSGNKGEWSEIYVVLKLLADGKLFSADIDMNRIENVFYPILKILREESKTNSKLEYVLNGNIKVVNSSNDIELIQVPVKEFVSKSKEFFKLLSTKKKSSFQIPEFEAFLEKIFIKTLKAKSEEKSDITLLVVDSMTSSELNLSFSIKSLLGSKPTLLNPGSGTNFIYKIEGAHHNEIELREFNSSTYLKTKGKGGSKISKRINRLIQSEYKLTFKNIQSEIFQLNLELIDRDLPQILAYMLLYKYIYNENKIVNLIALLNEHNPLNYNLAHSHPFYEYKLRGLLYDYALGMTPEKTWVGKYASTGGIIIVKKDGDALVYRVYDKNIFQDYLINNTFLDQASTGEDSNKPGNPRAKLPATSDEKQSKSKTYNFGWLYKNNGDYELKLNLQIRFIERKKAKKSS